MAFPEMIRHEYGNCNTCHVSISGGGILTDYGRALSAEAMSTWIGSEQEQKSMWGVVKLPEWFRVGADVRTIQTYRETERFKEGNYFMMQADAEVALGTDKLMIVGTAGREEIRTGQKSKGEFLSRRHYVQGSWADGYYARAGKFRKTFGINTADHATATKRGLGMDHTTETYNAELAYIGKELNLSATAVAGRPDDKDKKKTTEKGGTATVSYLLADRYKVGASYFQGKSEVGSRRLGGPWLIAGITKKIYVLYEHDFAQTWANPDMKGDPVTHWAASSKQAIEVVRGLHLYVMEDYAKRDVSDKLGSYQAFGPGLQWFPRPHFELNMQVQKQRMAANQRKLSDFAWIMAHVYL